MEENKDIMIKNGDKIVISIGKKTLIGIAIFIIAIGFLVLVYASHITEFGTPNIINMTEEFAGDILAHEFYQDGCKSGFERFGLGCIQINEEGNNIPDLAMKDCYDTYGGRLPYQSEISIAFQNLNLNNKTDGAELIADITPYTSGYPNTWCAISEMHNSTNFSSITYFECNIPKDYRCFVPFVGGKI